MCSQEVLEVRFMAVDDVAVGKCTSRPLVELSFSSMRSAAMKWVAGEG